MVWKFFSADSARVRQQTAANNAVRKALKPHRDDGTAARHVVHYAYPDAAADLSLRPQMIAELKAQGFEVRDAAVKQGLVLEHHRPVARGEFDAFTAGLASWFSARGWDYDGWECAVVPGAG